MPTYNAAVKALAIVGCSGAGKTTLLERLVPALEARGVRVGVIKHTHHRGAAIDRAGTDTARMIGAGARAALLIGPDVLLQRRSRPGEPSLAEALALLGECDLALVESWSAEKLSCIEVVGDDGRRHPADRFGPVLARVSDDAGAVVAGDGPRFVRDDVDAIADFVREWWRG